MPYCVNCGYKLAGNEEECPSCGQRVSLSRTTAYQVNNYGTAAGAAGTVGTAAAGTYGANPVPKTYQVNTGTTGSYGTSPTYGTGSNGAPTQTYSAQPAYGTQTYATPSPYGTSVSSTPAPVSNEKGSVGWWFLGFFFPLIGLILFLVWRKDRRGDARKAGFGALTGTILQIVFSILLVIAAAMMDLDDYSSDYGYTSGGYGHSEGLRSEIVMVVDE